MKDYDEEIEFDDINEDDFEQEGSKKPRKGIIARLFSLLMSLAVIVFLAYSVLALRYISCVNIAKDAERVNHGVETMSSKNTINILLIGSDTRTAEDKGRADTVILLSVNKKSKAIVLTSFMRDSFVEIPGHGSSKLNAAYRYGGAELLMDTLEVNFKLDIDDYVYINFNSFSNIVDAVGKIELTVTEAEAEGMKSPMAEQNDLLGNPKGTDYLSGAGTYLMNGNQALAYARLRYVGNADFQRTERQREVILKIIEKAKTLPLGKLDKFLKTCAENITTNMSKKDMYLLSLSAVRYAGYELEGVRIPADECYSGSMIDGQSVLIVDFEKNIEILKDKLYSS